MAVYHIPASMGAVPLATTRERATARPGTQVARAKMANASCLVAGGLGILAAADAVSVSSAASTTLAQVLFWLGLAFLFVPTATLLFGTYASRTQRVALVTQLGMALYLVKVFEYPLSLVQVDEGPHIRNAANIVATGHLFGSVPLVPIVAWFPGLEIVASTLSVLTGLSLTASGMIVAGAARLLLVLTLYLFFEQLVRSSRMAGIAMLIYMANPSFLFFDAQFAYETMGIALAAFVLFAAAKYTRLCSIERHPAAWTFWSGWSNWSHGSHGYSKATWGASRVAYLMVALGALAALAVTHHVTSYLVALFLLLWAAVCWWHAWTQHQQGERWVPWRPTILAVAALVINVLWIVVTKGQVISYLAPIPEGMLKQAQSMAAGGSGRALFKGGNGDPVPPWELLVSLGTAGLLTVGACVGVLGTWQRYRRNTLVVALGVASLVYPVTLVMRLTPAGGLAGNRMTSFAYLPLALGIAIALTRPPRLQHLLPAALVASVAGARDRGVMALAPSATYGRSVARPRAAATPLARRSAQSCALTCLLVALTAFIFMGGVIAGAPQAWKQLPGSYLVDADQRSVTPQGMDAVLWMDASISPGNRVATDIGNRELIIGYSDQQVASPYDAPLLPLFGAPTFGATQQNIIATDQIGYLLVDQRLSTAYPYSGSYVGDYQEGSEVVPGLAPGTAISQRALTKFNRVPHINRIFDNGTIIIYQTEIGADGN